MAGIKDRLDKLTTGEVKALVAKAVAAEKKAPSKDGDALLALLQKNWAEALKVQKLHDAELAGVEAKVKATVGAKGLDDPLFAAAEKAMQEARKRVAMMNASLTKFETARAAAEKKWK